MRSLRTSCRVALGVVLLSLAAAPARAGVFGNPFPDDSICGDTGVAAAMAVVSIFNGSSHCPALCRAASAQCHGLVARVSACLTAVGIGNAAFETRNCNESADPISRRICRASIHASLIAERAVIVTQRDTAFLACGGWETGCQNACP